MKDSYTEEEVKKILEIYPKRNFDIAEIQNGDCFIQINNKFQRYTYIYIKRGENYSLQAFNARNSFAGELDNKKDMFHREEYIDYFRKYTKELKFLDNSAPVNDESGLY